MRKSDHLVSYRRMWQIILQLFSLWLSVAVCPAAHVSTHNFTCLREITFFLIGSRLVERWRNLTVPRCFELKQQNPANGKDSDPHRHVTDTSWRSTAELTTNVKIAVYRQFSKLKWYIQKFYENYVECLCDALPRLISRQAAVLCNCISKLTL